MTVPNVPWYAQGPEWSLQFSGHRPERTLYGETVFSLANGYMGVRGYAEEPQEQANPVREGYLAGVFSDVDEEASRIIGEFPWPVLQMVSLPVIFDCSLQLNGETFDPFAGSLSEYERRLDLRTGLYTRSVCWTSPAGLTTRIRFERFLAADSPHLACHRVALQPENWSGPAEATFTLDAATPSIFRCGDKRQPHLPQYHFPDPDLSVDGNRGRFAATARHTGHRVAVAARLDAPQQTAAINRTRIVQKAVFSLNEQEEARCTRLVAVATSRDDETAGNPERFADSLLDDPARQNFDDALATNKACWDRRWAEADILIDGDPVGQKVVRYNLFQLLQMAPFHTDRISIPARAYAFNRYRGLYFWDTEIFILPFYSWVFPEVARNLLGFRYHTLAGARGNAEKWGGRGAFYPWMTDSDTGLDNSIDARIWKLLHQTADIAYAVDEYGRISGDLDFMTEKGLPILIETARFFASRFEAGADGLYHLEQTIGPDEDRLPGRDNGFTNLMARHNLLVAAAWMQRLEREHPAAAGELRTRLHCSAGEAAEWERMAGAICVPEVPDLGIPLQDEFFLHRKPADVVGWRLRETPDRWQLPEGTPADYQVIKQADIILAMLLLAKDYTPQALAAAYDFYEPKTMHISSLSWNTHAILAARLGRTGQAYEYYLKSAGLDLDDVNRVTDDGLHAAALGGCWQAVVLGCAGLGIRDNELACEPHLPPEWRSVRFQVRFKGKKYAIEARQDGAATIREQQP